MGLDLIFYWTTQLLKAYFAKFENVFMYLVAYFSPITKDSIIQNLVSQLSIFKTETSNSEI